MTCDHAPLVYMVMTTAASLVIVVIVVLDMRLSGRRHGRHAVPTTPRPPAPPAPPPTRCRRCCSHMPPYRNPTAPIAADRPLTPPGDE